VGKESEGKGGENEARGNMNESGGERKVDEERL
jgi:hypothetical protein